MASSQERQADGGLSGQWTPGVQVTRSRREATSVPRPVQVASSKSVMETNRGCAGELILQPLNGVLPRRIPMGSSAAGLWVQVGLGSGRAWARAWVWLLWVALFWVI